MSSYRTCLDCPAPVKFRDRDRCHGCHRRAERAALKRDCLRCGTLRHLHQDGRCALCRRVAQAAQDHQLPTLRPATTKRRARHVQLLPARRPGAPGPIGRIPGCTAAIDPAVVEPAGRVRERPLPPQRVGGRPTRDRPGTARPAEPVAPPALSRCRCADQRNDRTGPDRVLHQPGSDPGPVRGPRARRTPTPALSRGHPGPAGPGRGAVQQGPDRRTGPPHPYR